MNKESSKNIGFRNASSDQLLSISKQLLTESREKFYCAKNDKENLLKTKNNSISKKKLKYKNKTIARRNSLRSKLDFDKAGKNSPKSHILNRISANCYQKPDKALSGSIHLLEKSISCLNTLDKPEKKESFAENSKNTKSNTKTSKLNVPQLLENRENTESKSYTSSKFTYKNKIPRKFSPKMPKIEVTKKSTPRVKTASNTLGVKNFPTPLSRRNGLKMPENRNSLDFDPRKKPKQESGNLANFKRRAINSRKEKDDLTIVRVENNGYREVITAGKSNPYEKVNTIKTVAQGPPMKLSPDQNEILNHVLQGKNVFFTGCAGTGKSVLINEIKSRLKDNNVNVEVTASTGLAAHNLNGRTLHSWSGIGLGKGKKEDISRNIRKIPRLSKSWKNTDALIVDEISMISGTIFEKLEYIARKVKGKEKPFGGLQLILCGDFLQLPPVNANKLTFETQAWQSCIPDDCIFELTEVFRQKNKEFVQLLSQIRIGKLSPTNQKILADTSQNVLDKNATIIYSHRHKVSHKNALELKKIKTESHMYEAEDASPDRKSKDYLKRLFEKCPIPYRLALKVGAPVILLKNLSKDLVNGLSGVVVGFQKDASEKEPFPVIEFKSLGKTFIIEKFAWTIERADGSTVASRRQMPLELCWALTIHKCQGMTLDSAAMDLGSVWEPGHFYVAVSRLRTLSGLKLLGNFSKSGVMANPKVITWMKNKGLLKKENPADFDHFDDYKEIEFITKTTPNPSRKLGQEIDQISKPLLPPGLTISSPLSYLQKRSNTDRERRKSLENRTLENIKAAKKETTESKTVKSMPRRFSVSESDFLQLEPL